MNSITLKDGDQTWQRVSKVAARKAWDAGKPVVFCPVKLHPFGGFRPSIQRQRDFADEEQRKSYGLDVPTFDQVSQDFAWYNCTCETGYYPSYWIAV